MTLQLVEHCFAGAGALAVVVFAWRLGTIGRRRRARRRGVLERPTDGPPCPVVEHDRHCEFRRGHPWPCWFGDRDPKLLERV
jgi:hypothetical protein